MPVHLDAEVLGDGDARGRGDTSGRGADQLGLDATPGGVRVHVDLSEHAVDLVGSGGVLLDPTASHETFLDDHRDERSEAERVGTWAHLQVEVGELGGLAALGVDHHHRSRRVVGDLLQRRARGMPWLCHGFLPTNTVTSAWATSACMLPPSILPFTQNSPVFSCESAPALNFDPSARSVAPL